jgi:heptosyltransferase-2
MIRTDCRNYRGHIPCKFHKQKGAICEQCTDYEQIEGRILIIKLGAAGDVIRTTPLLRRLKKEYPGHEISWLTYYPDLLSDKWVDNILEFNFQNIIWLKEQKFDWVINLDKDREALALTKALNASKKSGFTMDNFGKCIPVSNDAERHKWLTGLRDDFSRANTKNYMEEIFEICGYKFNKERYILDVNSNGTWDTISTSKKVIGLNTGCGERWPSRLWPDEKWIELSYRLIDSDHEVILLGGPQEDKRNKTIAQQTGAKYLGYFSLKTFMDLVNHCDVVVSQVSMTMHIAIALDKKLILINNIFNKNEFYLYGNGIIIEPEVDCLGCYKSNYDENCPVRSCMDLVTADNVYSRVQFL